METNNNTTQPEEMEISEEQTPQPQKLPLAYVMYLTMRSKFIDLLALHDEEILSKWKEYENQQILLMEQQQNALIKP